VNGDRDEDDDIIQDSVWEDMNNYKGQYISIMIRSVTLKMEATASPKMLVTTYKITWQHNPEDNKQQVISNCIGYINPTFN
jgi:hypothetical protein